MTQPSKQAMVLAKELKSHAWTIDDRESDVIDIARIIDRHFADQQAKVAVLEGTIELFRTSSESSTTALSTSAKKIVEQNQTIEFLKKERRDQQAIIDELRKDRDAWKDAMMGDTESAARSAGEGGGA